MKAIYRKRWQDLANLMRQVPRKDFNQDFPCSCQIGHYCKKYPRRLRSWVYTNELTDHFNITYYEANDWFGMTGQTGVRTPLQAAKKIEKMLKETK